MRKILIAIIILIITVLTCFTISYGISIGKIRIYKFSDIQQSSKDMNSKLEEANKITTITYDEKMSALKSAAKELQKVREEYENKIQYSSDEEIKTAAQKGNYKVEFLWTKLGNYATKEGVVLKLDITTNSNNKDLKDLKFTVTGSYIGITDFIYDIEEDSKLAFKIENFSMKPITTSTTNKNTQNNTIESTVQTINGLQATFIVKNINVEVVISEENTNKTQEQNNTTNTTNDNATNTTNSTNTTQNAVNNAGENTTNIVNKNV